jgi:hypothetical protein
VAGSLYFSLIGMGFMLAEIALLQRFSVYLGHPISRVSQNRAAAQRSRVGIAVKRYPAMPRTETDCGEGRDTWLTELLARASREEDEDYQDFAQRRELRRGGINSSA